MAEEQLSPSSFSWDRVLTQHTQGWQQTHGQALQPGTHHCSPQESGRDSLQIWHSAVFVPWGEVPGQSEASVLLLVVFLLTHHMFDKNKFNLMHFEFFFFAVPSYFRSASIIEGLPYKQDSSFSRDCTIATFLLYWIQKGMLFLKWVLQHVIYLSLSLNAPQLIVIYLWVQQKTFWVGLGCKVTCPLHLTWCGFSILQF